MEDEVVNLKLRDLCSSFGSCGNEVIKHFGVSVVTSEI